MSESNLRYWIKILFGGLGVAAFTTLAPFVWDLVTKTVSHRHISTETVAASLHVENGVLLLSVTNSSDDPLDLRAAEIQIDGVADLAGEFGAYPEPSHIYQVDSQSDAELRQHDGDIFVKLRIIQVIKPGETDQFGFKINGAVGSLTPAIGSLSGTVTDSKGNTYPVKY